jgi:GntR family transcriptional regulator, arabinose operon transcriptional repressor
LQNATSCNINIDMISSSHEVAPKYQQVFDSLRREILSGRYRPGEKLPSEADLVKRFGASRITIGRAVRELREQDLIDRRAGSGTYVRSAKSSGLTFGLLIPNLGQTDIFEPMCQGMADASQGGRHALLWGYAEETPSRNEQAWRLCQQYVERGVSGVFFAPLELGAEDALANRRIAVALDKARIPMVLLDRCYLPYPHRSRYDLVGIDNRRAGYLITEHLLQVGSRRIAFVACPHSASTVEARIAGYREALFFHDIPFERSLVRRFDVGDREAVRQFMERELPQALICANDHAAGKLMHALLALGFRIPDQVRIAGIDNAPYSSLLPVPLTTVHQPSREIGMTAMGVMLDRLARPAMPTRDVFLATKLVVRDSCGASKVQAPTAEEPMVDPLAI